MNSWERKTILSGLSKMLHFVSTCLMQTPYRQLEGKKPQSAKDSARSPLYIQYHRNPWGFTRKSSLDLSDASKVKKEKRMKTSRRRKSSTFQVF